MTKLAEIQRVHAPELQLLNDRIGRQLESNNTLMSRVVNAQLRTRGKQLRPLMLMLCAQMFIPVDDRVVASAAAVELLHNASLIHDDVVDNSPCRRGTPTVNAIWDNHIAVLVGDFFTSSAMQQAISTGDIRIVETLCALGRQLSLGEIDQIFNARQHTLSVEQYFKVIDYKTASLFVSSAVMGGICGGASEKEIAALNDFAMAFGRCFQIRDDIFDYFDADQVGKPTGNDLKEGKITLPLLYALESAPADEASTMRSLLDQESLSEDEIALLQAFARKNRGIEKAYATMERLQAEGSAALATLPPCSERDELAALFDFIISRSY